MFRNDISARFLFSLMLIIGLLYIPSPVFSQQSPELQNLIVNGNFEEGVQDFGVGYSWGAFSNGQAIVGWSTDTWDKVVPTGQRSAQMIEIKDAQALNRYGGIYQTVTVVPGAQYKLTIKGLIRSTEGDIAISDYGYRLQVGVDQSGGTAWELVADNDWQELTWDEQALFDPAGGIYRFDTHQSTITAESDQLTLFIRGWKKWINNGSGIFDIQEVSLVGPAPTGIAAPLVQTAAVESPAETTTIETSPAEEVNVEEAPAETVENAASEFVDSSSEVVADNANESVAVADETVSSDVVEAQPEAQTVAPVNEQLMLEPPVSTQPQASVAPLPESGRGENDSIKYIVISGVALLLILMAGAVTATTARRRKQPE
jgi:hypothetical protein